MDIKPEHVNECYWETRIAPYVLILGAIGFGISVVSTKPLYWSLPLAMLHGILVLFIKVRTWKGGPGWYNGAALLVGLVLLSIVSRFMPETLQLVQYLCFFFISHSAALLALRSKISLRTK